VFEIKKSVGEFDHEGRLLQPGGKEHLDMPGF